MKKKTQRLVSVTMALPEDWPVPVRRAPAGPVRPSKKSTVRIIRIGTVKEQVRLLTAPIFNRTRVSA